MQYVLIDLFEKWRNFQLTFCKTTESLAKVVKFDRATSTYFAASCRRLITKRERAVAKPLLLAVTQASVTGPNFSTSFTSLLHSPCLCSADRSRTDSGLTSCCPASDRCGLSRISLLGGGIKKRAAHVSRVQSDNMRLASNQSA